MVGAIPTPGSSYDEPSSCSHNESVSSNSSKFVFSKIISSSKSSSIMDMLMSIANVILDNWRAIYSHKVDSLNI